MTETETGPTSHSSTEPTSPAPAAGEPASGPPHVSGISRAITAPVRAVTRIFNSAAPSTVPSSARAGAAVVDCGFYIAGVRQPGEWDYVHALAAARKRD